MMQWIADLTPVLYLIRFCIIALASLAFVGWGVLCLARRRI